MIVSLSMIPPSFLMRAKGSWNSLLFSTTSTFGIPTPILETGERLLVHQGACARKHKTHMEIVMDAEIEPTEG
jgi:hypothetical protein